MTPFERVMTRGRSEDRGYSTPCRVYTNRLRPDGYARLFVGRDETGRRRLKYAHRIVWEHHHGPMPDGLQIDHLCRQRDCHEITHLEAVTRLENVRRGIGAQVARARHATRTHCRYGHELTPENTALVPQKHGCVARVCRTCRAARKRQYRQNARTA